MKNYLKMVLDYSYAQSQSATAVVNVAFAVTTVYNYELTNPSPPLHLTP